MKVIIIQNTTKSKKQAKKISKLLLRKKLAACIHICMTNSLYIWEKKFCEEVEYLISIKTKKKYFKKVKREIKKLNSYEVPEIISFKADKLSKDYKNFIKDNTQ